MNTVSRPKRRPAPQRVCFQGYRLESAFQPVFSLSHRRAVGFEALIRAHTPANRPVTPAELFQGATDPSSVLALDELCQQVHVDNFARAAAPDRWLFINLTPATLTNERYRSDFLPQVMARAGLGFHRLVVEILEGAIDDESVLMDVVNHFRSLGALVALDDFGAGHSNFDRLWRLLPDIIKLDRSIIAEAEQHRAGQLRRMLPNLVALMHEVGSLVLAEGVETQDQALIALDADIDFVQGFYLAHPEAQMLHHSARMPKLDRLTERFANTATGHDREDRQILLPYKEAFREAAAMLRNGRTSEQACARLMNMARTARCYSLDEHGEPVFHHEAQWQHEAPDKRFNPILDTSEGSWFRRPYFRAAMDEPRRLQISRPYLSSIGQHMCVTLSMSNKGPPRHVFCCDISW